MVDPDVFDRRLGRLEELLAHLRELAKTPQKTYLRDEGLQAQAERWLHLAAECMLDLAHHLIAERGWPTPTTYRESLRILERQEVLSEELADRLEPWAGLRNLLVHLYLEVDHRRILEILANDLDDLEAYAAALARAAEPQE